MRKILILLAVLIFSLLLISYFLDLKSTQIKYIQIGNTTIDKVEVVDTPATRERGLSGREAIEADYGMLFVFQKPDVYKFWMKEMNFPIDMIWLDENFRVVGLKEDAQPSSYPAAFGPEQPAKYVLEVTAGIAQKESLKLGSVIVFGR